MHFSKPLFASPGKRLAATAIDAAVVFCCGWFLTSIVTRDWYPVADFSWGLPLCYWIYESFCLVRMRGASPGRRLFDIQVVSAFGKSELLLWQSLLRPGVRVAFFAVLVLTVAPAPTGQFDLVIIPLLMEVGLLFTSASVTLADLVAGTRVVNTPPLQPHRAPAAPMYSATDAEFGYPPRKKKS